MQYSQVGSGCFSGTVLAHEVSVAHSVHCYLGLILACVIQPKAAFPSEQVPSCSIGDVACCYCPCNVTDT